MRIISAALLMAAGLTLAACKDEAAAPPCTQAQAQAKIEDMMAEMMALASTNPQKMAELSPKLEEIAKKAQASSSDDLAAACKAIDDMIAELG